MHKCDAHMDDPLGHPSCWPNIMQDVAHNLIAMVKIIAKKRWNKNKWGADDGCTHKTPQNIPKECPSQMLMQWVIFYKEYNVWWTFR